MSLRDDILTRLSVNKKETCIGEYKGTKALAKALGVGLSTAQKYLNRGIYADVDLPTIGRPPKGHKNAMARKRLRSTSADKHYRDFIADMETWE
jgi:hypothetical protein